MKRLIVAPTEFELAVIVDTLKCKKEKALLDFAVYRCGGRDVETVVLRSGAGMANAAAATAIGIMQYGPDHVYNVGVCGVYGDRSDLITEVVVGTSAVFADSGVDTGDGFLSMQSIDLPLAKPAGGQGVFNVIGLDDSHVSKKMKRCIFLTLAASSGSPRRAEHITGRFKLEQGKLLCEDMESAAVALMALKAGIACTVVRAISNCCGDRNYDNWKLSDAALAAQKELLKCL